MSGILGAAFPQPTQLGTLPPEGARSVSVGVPWLAATGNLNGFLNGNYSYPINLLSQYQSGRFTTVQAVWIDNSTCPYAVSLTCAESAQILTLPAFSQGIYPLIVQQAPSFVATLIPVNFGSGLVLACTTTFIFLNVPSPCYQQQQSPLGAQFSFNFVSSVFGAGNNTVLPAAPVGRRYLINSFYLVLETIATYSGTCSVILSEQGAAGAGIIWEDQVTGISTTGGGVIEDKGVNFSSPILLPGGGILAISFSGPAQLATYMTINYGLVTIQ